MFAILMPFGATPHDATRRKRAASPLAPMCDATGGRCHTAAHLKHALQLAETLAAQRLLAGVNVAFDASPPLTARSEPFALNPRRMLLVNVAQSQVARSSGCVGDA